MTNVLDQPVPRDVIAQILPESYALQTTIDELGEGRKMGCLRHVKRAEVDIYEAMLTECRYKFTTLLSEDEDDVYILFFTNPEDDDVREALLLEQRELGMMEPPLSINEHLKLATAYGVPEELQEQFKSRVLLALGEQSEEPSEKQGDIGTEIERMNASVNLQDRQEFDRELEGALETIDPELIADAVRKLPPEEQEALRDRLSSMFVFDGSDEEDDYMLDYGDETFPSTAMFDD